MRQVFLLKKVEVAACESSSRSLPTVRMRFSQNVICSANHIVKRRREARIISFIDNFHFVSYINRKLLLHVVLMYALRMDSLPDAISRNKTFRYRLNS